MKKFIVTVGPSTEKSSSLKYILKKTNLIRLNFSHNSIDWHEKIIKKIKLIKKDAIILIDIPGIKPRTLNDKPILIKKNQKVIFYFKKKPKNNKYLSIPLSNIIPTTKRINKSNFFSVDDGNFKFKTIMYKKDYIIGSSYEKFVLEKLKGINIVNSIYDSKLQEKKYLQSLKIISKLNVDAVGLSYIQNAKTINLVKKKYPKLLVVSKIENYEGILKVEEICKTSDIIMIDRGDLSAEVGEENLFESILEINKFSKKYSKPIIMATENLRSMVNRNTPDKSEIIALGMSKMLDVDSLMLSEETATSKNWKIIINWLLNYNKKTKLKNNIFFNADNFNNPLFDKINSLKNTNVIIFLKKGYLISEIKKIDPSKEIFIFSDNQKLLNNLEFYSNIFTFKINLIDKKFSQIKMNSLIKKYKKYIFRKYNEVILIFTSFPIKGSKANTFSLLKKRNFN